MWVLRQTYWLLLVLFWSATASANVLGLAHRRFVNGTSSSTLTSTTKSTISHVITTPSTTLDSSPSTSLASKKKVTTSHVVTTLSTILESSPSTSLVNKNKVTTSHVTTTRPSSTPVSSSSLRMTTKKATTGKQATTSMRTTSEYRMHVGEFCKSEALKSSTGFYCRVSVGTIQLHYWPTGTAALNKTFPKTKVLSKYDFTMTSPSIYYVINTMQGYQLCNHSKTVGTTIKNHITGFDLTQVSTLQPFEVKANGKPGATRIGNPLPLQLSDLKDDCPSYTVGFRQKNTVESPKCNPVLEYHGRILDVQAAWDRCGRTYGGFFGIFDPPVPVQACLSNDCGNEGAEKAPEAIQTPPPSPTPTTTAKALADQQSTAVASPLPNIPPSPGPTIIATHPKVEEGEKTPLIDTKPTVDQANPTTTPKVIAGETPKENDPANVPDATIKVITDAKTPTSTTPPIQNEIASPNASTKPTPIPQTIATVAGQIIPISAIDTSLVIIGSQTISVGGLAATITGHQVLSLASNGIIVQIPGGGLTTIPLPQTTTLPDKLVSIAGEILHISAIHSSVIVIGTQTLTVSGSAATLAGNQIASLGSSGIVLVVSGGKTTIPVFTSTSNEKVATVAGQVLSITALHSSIVVIGSQTLTLGGSVVTVSGNQVISLASNGIVVQIPAGGETTIALSRVGEATPTLSVVSATTGTKAASNVGGGGGEGTATRTLITPVNTGLGQIINDMVTTSAGRREVGSKMFPWFGIIGLGVLGFF